MPEKLPENLNLFRRLRLGRETVRALQAAEAQRIAAFEAFFPDSKPEEAEQYLYGRVPIIQPKNASPLAAMLLEGLGDGTASLCNIAEQRPDVRETRLQGQAILPYTQIEHQRPHGNTKSPGELDGWFVGTMHIASLTYGRGVALLLQPSQVELP